MSSKQVTAHVDLEAVAHNLQLARTLAPNSKVMAVIKADAYGHGAIQVARKLKDADVFAVARVSEAVKLREAGISTPICLLEGVINREELNLASVYELQVVVHNLEQLALLGEAGARRTVWLKIDTGMGRLGIRLEEAEAALDQLGQQKLLGLMTHFSRADESDPSLTAQQLERLRQLSDACKKKLPEAGVLNCANSAALLRHPDSRVDWVRPGLMLYGASPMSHQRPDDQLMPAMTLSAPVISLRQTKKGESVGYGAEWTADQDTRIAVVAAGYGDGYPREIRPRTQVLVNGQRREIVGRVSMDMLSVRLLAEDRVVPGDHVVLWGEGLPIEEIAQSAGTIAYTLMCGITARVRRTYRGAVRG